MEIIIVVALAAVAIWWFFIRKPDNSLVGQPVTPEEPTEAPYKVEPPVEAVVEPAASKPTLVVETGTPTVTSTVEKADAKPKRTRTKTGKFVGDNKVTSEVNEAWVDGVAPAKKPKAAKPAKTEKAAKPAKITAAPKKPKATAAEKPAAKPRMTRAK